MGKWIPHYYGGDVGEPEVATFMDQQPWTIRFGDFPLVRERIRQAVFSNMLPGSLIFARSFRL